MADNVNIIVQDTINDIVVNAAVVVETIDINVQAAVDTVDIVANPNNYVVNINRIIGEQVQSDWDQADNQTPDYIKNKPTIPTATSDLTNDGEDGINPFITAADVTPQVNSDWDATSGVAEILNKPTIPAAVTKTSDLTNDGENGVDPFITAADIPPVTGFVPYTGATEDVDLGVHDLTATQGTFATSGNPDTLTVNHSSGSGKALTITKGGAGEGIYVNKTSGSGNAVTIVGDLEATNLKRTGGTSSQFLKADGSVDSNTYFQLPSLTSGSVLFSNGTTIAQDNANLFWDDANNRLGIGTSSPVGKFTVSDGTRSGGFNPNTGLNSFVVFTSTNHPLVFATNNNQNARIFTTGNLAINTTTDAGYRLDVNGNSRVKGAGATNSSNAFVVQNSAGNNALSVANGLTTIVHQDLQLGNTVLYWNGGSQIRNISNGVLRITNSSNSDFTRLQFGGGTNAFPSLQRSGSALCVVDSTGTFLSNLLVGTTTDVASSKLTVESTTQGFLPPRMTTTQKNAIATPAAGLVVYDTDLQSLAQYNGTSWLNINSNLPLQITPVTLTAASWTLVSGLYEYDYSNVNITSTSIVDVIPSNSTIAIVQAASILPSTESTSGSVKLFATNLPTADIIVTFNIFN